eukprot:8288948-Pyramimonas_sp.AAC.3
MTWTRPKVSGTAPPGRGGHAACALGKKVYVFGGANRSPEAFKDMWALDTGTCCLMPPFAVTHDRNLTPDELRTLPRCDGKYSWSKEDPKTPEGVQLPGKAVV